MTRTQALRAERRLARERMERERRWRAARAVALLAGLLLAFGLAGAMDLADREANLSSMLPTACERG